MGALGAALATATRRAGLPLAGSWTRDPRRAATLRRRLGLYVASGDLPRELATAELVLLCVSDDAIGEVGALLAGSGLLRPGAVVAHTSGCLAGAALGELGVARGSVHPMVAVPRDAAPVSFLDVCVAIEGETRATTLLARFAAALGARPFHLDAATKARYHAATVLASNLVVALLAEAQSELAAAGVAAPESTLLDLARGALARAAELGLAPGLTGPIVRGDTSTVARHLEALSSGAREIYVSLSRRALSLAVSRGLAGERLDRIARLLAPPPGGRF
jgi:predicted short-subunit dehydrogenase-like oxidoreductase (DUF2520 family)